MMDSGWENDEYPPLVSPQWLEDYVQNNEDTLGDPKVRILDGSWHPPVTKRSGAEEWKVQHIQGALHFDIAQCVDESDPKLVFMPPTVPQFEEYVGRLGINNETHVIVYDNNANIGMLSAPRIWWLFRLFGHDRVSILSGGFPEWKKGRPTTNVVQRVEPQTFKAQYRPELIKSYEDVVANAKADGDTFQLIDSRPPAKFAGRLPEPNQANGHVPGAKNTPHATIYDEKTRLLKEKEGLIAAFGGIKLSHPTTIMCVTGITATNLAFALHLLRAPEVSIYEGGWTEWVQRADDTMKVKDGSDD